MIAVAEITGRATLHREMAAVRAELERRGAATQQVVQRLKDSLPPKMRQMLRRARYKGAHGGRGSAKSQSFARLLLIYCLEHTGTRALCVREIQLSLEQSVRHLLVSLIHEFKLEQHGFKLFENRIVTPGNGLIAFKGMQDHNASTVKSLEAFDLAWVEEAQTLSSNSLKLLRPTIRKPGSELWFTWNPESDSDPIDQLLRGKTPPADALVIEMNWQDNPHFPPELQQEKDEDFARDPEDRRACVGRRYVTRSKASVFSNISVRDFEVPDDADPLYGGDWGFANDPTALVQMFTHPRHKRTLFIRREKVGVGVEIDDTPAFFDALDPEKPQLARTYEIVCDSARPETISYMQRHGYPRIRAAKKGPNSVEEGVKFLQSFQQIVIHKTDCPVAAKEFVGYKYRVHRQTGVVLNELVDADNHTIDSARYGLEDLITVDEGVLW